MTSHQNQQQAEQGPPYMPMVAQVGGRPTVDVDVPILAVLLALYIGGAATHMTIFQLNRRRGHKFFMSAVMFGFCMSRVATCCLRIAWAVHPTNINLAIASNIFTNVGVIIVYIILLLLASRLFRATHPRLGWSRGLSIAYKTLYFILFIAIALLVAFILTSLYTLNMELRTDAMWIERAGILLMLLFNVITLVLLLLSALLPRASDSENFGEGSMASKFLVHGVALFFALFIAGYRMGTLWAPARPITDPGWYDLKPAFYVIDLAFEIVIIYWLAIMRFDRKFWVPNGSSKPGDYSRVMLDEGRQKNTSIDSV